MAWSGHSKRRVAPALLVLVALAAALASCGDSSGPTNTELLGQGAGVSAVSIADVPTDRDAPATAAAISSRLVVYEGPALTGATAQRSARLWVYVPDSGTWSDPLDLDAPEPLVGLTAVPVAVTDPGTGRVLEYLVVAGQQCPDPQVGATRGEWTCHSGTSRVVALTIALASPPVVTVTVGAEVATFGADGSIGPGRSFAPALVAWDGTRVVIVPRSSGAGSASPTNGTPQSFDPAAQSFAPGTPGTADAVPASCGRPTHVAVGVTATLAEPEVVTSGVVSEVRGPGAPARVIACSNNAAVLRSEAGLTLIALSDGPSTSRPALTGLADTAGATAIALTVHQAVVVSPTAIVVASTDRPLVTLAEGAFVPATLTTDGQDSYVQRVGPRLGFTRLVDQR